MSSTESIALIRCAPETAESQRLQAWLDNATRVRGLLFFQADGVEHALSADWFSGLDIDALDLLVCEGSWRRRFEQAPPVPFRLGSLVEFFARLDQAKTKSECFSARS